MCAYLIFSHFMHLKLGCRAVHVTFPSNLGAQRLDNNQITVFNSEFVEHLGALAHIALAITVEFGAFLKRDVFQIKHKIVQMG